MLSRRELITAGVAGSLTAAPSGAALPAAAPSPAEEQPADRDGQREIARQLLQIQSVLEYGYRSSSLSHGFVGKIRQQMEQFLRANAKFPDFMEIGHGVFMDLYDWHIKNRQQLLVTRQADGRYTMTFMFTTMILRTEQDPPYIGIPYDKA